jgi:hypothetical protein
MYFVIIKLNMNSQYNCANVSVELTSITVLTKMNIIKLCLFRDCAVGVGPEKIPHSKKQTKGTTFQRVTLDKLVTVLFLMLQKYDTFQLQPLPNFY